MKHYLIELYTPNTKWKALSLEERKQFLNSVGTAMSGLSDLGVQALTLTEIESKVDQSSEHQFLAVWHFPNKEACDVLLNGIKASGWYNYFDHVNAVGKESSFIEHLDALSSI